MEQQTAKEITTDSFGSFMSGIFAPPTLNFYIHSSFIYIKDFHMFEENERKRTQCGDDHLDKVPASEMSERTFKWLFKKTLKSFRFQPTQLSGE